jgi:hypothetical protein
MHTTVALAHHVLACNTASCSDTRGPGLFLRSFIFGSIVLLILGAWIILRGYGKK